jgi:hypothetical protein
MAMYPFAAALSAALTSWLTGALPITVLHPLSAAFLGVASLYSYALTSRLLAGYPLRRVVCAVGVLLLFWPAHYLVRYQFGWSDFFFAQVLGHVWLMGSLYWTHRLAVRWDRLLVAPLLLSLLAAVLTYTVWLAVPVIGFAVAVALVGSVRVRERLLVSALVLGPVTLLLALFLKDRLAYFAITAASQGAVLAPTLDRLGETFIVLAAGGLAMAIVKRHWAVVAYSVVLLLQIGASYLAADQRVIGVYWAHKLWYQLVLLMAVCVALLAGEHLRRSVKAGMRGWWQAPAAVVLLVAALIPAWNEIGRTTVKAPPFGPDNYAAAEWAARNLPGTRLTFVNMPWVKSYWVHMALMRQPPKTIRLPDGGRESYGYADWQYDSRTGEYAYMQVMGPDPLADAQLLYRSGDVVILRRLRQPATIMGDTALIHPDGSGDLPAPIGSLYWLTDAKISDARFNAGGKLGLDLTLVPRGPVDRDVLLAAHLRSREGRAIATADYALDHASADARHATPEAGRLSLSLAVPAAAPPGVYELELFALTLPGYERERTISGDTGKEIRVLVGPLVVAPEGVGAQAPTAAHQSGARLGDSITLHGYDLAGTGASESYVVRGTLYWQASGTVDEDYTVFVQVLDAAGKLVAQSDRQPLGGQYPTSVWQAGEYVSDPFEVKLPVGTPPGEYQVIAGMYLLRTQQRLAVSAGGVPAGDYVRLGSVALAR